MIEASVWILVAVAALLGTGLILTLVSLVRRQLAVPAPSKKSA